MGWTWNRGASLAKAATGAACQRRPVRVPGDEFGDRGAMRMAAAELRNKREWAGEDVLDGAGHFSRTAR